MRMWHEDLIPYICSKHNNGGHYEIHKFRPDFEKRISIAGRINPIVQIEPDRMKYIHDLYAKRLNNHKTPYEMPDLSHLTHEERYARVDLKENIKTLSERCPKCRKNFKKHGII